MPPTRGHDLKQIERDAHRHRLQMPPTRGHDLKLPALVGVLVGGKRMPPTRGHDLKPVKQAAVEAVKGCPPHGGTT